MNNKLLYYLVGGHAYSISTADAETTDKLLASSRPFKLSQAPAEALLFSLNINNEWQAEVQGREVGQFDCGGCNHGVYLLDDGSYQIVVSDVSGAECCFMQGNADFSAVKVKLSGNMAQQRFGLNNALMMTYAFAAADKMTVLIHASVVRKENKGYLCLGVSGTGKSTHTGLWLKHIEGTDLMNDDNPVIRIGENGMPIVYGSPWSGKTPCYRNVSAPIGGFLQLKQAPFNRITPQTVIEAYVSLMPSCSSMKWDARCSRGVCDTVSAILKRVPTFLLECLPDEAACRLSHDTLTKR